MQAENPVQTAADYGIDAPGVIRNFGIFGIFLFVVGWFVPSFVVFGVSISFLASMLIWWGAAWILCSIFMVLYAKKGKFKHRDRMLAMVPWRGDEIVLDVGTGRGLLMIGAAHRLTSGKSIGIDIWNSEDLSDNKIENTLKNAIAEGVRDKIEIRSEDVRKMSFSDASFDVILSNLCIHNLYKVDEREAACKEIGRVLKPGGVAIISDFRHIKQYAESFQAMGLRSKIVATYWKDTFPKLTVLEIRK